MKRFAFKMYLKPGFEEEYERRHAALWPELKKGIKDAGVGNYSIYWDRDTNILFGYQEIEGEQSSQDMGADETRQIPTTVLSQFLSERFSILIESRPPYE